MIAHQNSRFKIQNHRNSSANIAVKLPVFDNSNLTFDMFLLAGVECHDLHI